MAKIADGLHNVRTRLEAQSVCGEAGVSKVTKLVRMQLLSDDSWHLAQCLRNISFSGAHQYVKSYKISSDALPTLLQAVYSWSVFSATSAKALWDTRINENVATSKNLLLDGPLPDKHGDLSCSANNHNLHRVAYQGHNKCAGEARSVTASEHNTREVWWCMPKQLARLCWMHPNPWTLMTLRELLTLPGHATMKIFPKLALGMQQLIRCRGS